MDRFVADPEWHGLIIAYFYLGGIAAGAYAAACLARLFGDEEDRRATRAAFYLAFPLVSVCGLLLVVDLGRPERFWHMVIQSNTGRPMFKWWSPMSVGSMGLSLFGFFSFASFLGVMAQDGRLGLGRFSGLATRLEHGPLARLFELGGLLSAFFLGSYTGALLSASNQPVWAQSTWIAPLFLASATSTGVAAVILMDRLRGRDLPEHAIARLERLDAFAMALEMLLLVVFAVSLGRAFAPAFRSWPGVLVPAFVVPVGLLIPLALRIRAWKHRELVGAVLVLIGGLVLRAAVVGMPAIFLEHG